METRLKLENIEPLLPVFFLQKGMIKMSTWLPSALINGCFALFASFSGAWVALKFQERHEAKKRDLSKRETGVRGYYLLIEQLTVLTSLKKTDLMVGKKGVWLTAVSRLAKPNRSISFDTASFQIFLPEMTSSLFRDIVIAQNRFLATMGYLEKPIDDIQPERIIQIERDLEDSIVLLRAVTDDLGFFLNERFSMKLSLFKHLKPDRITK